MQKDKYSVILVYATSHAVRAEKLLKRAEISCRMIPVPRHLSSDCGVCVRINRHDQIPAVNILEKNNLKTNGIYKLNRKEN